MQDQLVKVHRLAGPAGDGRGGLEFFVKPWSYRSLVVSRRVMKEMKKLGLTGISFDPVGAS